MTSNANDHVQDLIEWELPQVDALEAQLVARIANAKLSIPLTEAAIGKLLYGQVFDQIRRIARTTVNEAITYWLQNVIESGDCDSPLGVEFPYLSEIENCPPLTLSYSVRSDNGKRIALKRIDLSQVFETAIPVHGQSPADLDRFTRMVRELRKLADTLEAAAHR